MANYLLLGGERQKGGGSWGGGGGGGGKERENSFLWRASPTRLLTQSLFQIALLYTCFQTRKAPLNAGLLGS